MSELAFDGQRQGEKVKLVFRRHILTAGKGLVWFVVVTAVGLIPLFLWPGEITMFWIWLGFLAVGLLGLLYSYTLWYFSVFILTDQRLRQVTQKGLFKKTVTDLGLDKIESISYQVKGIRGSLLDYGTILIQTGVGDLTISVVPHPEKVYNKLQNLTRK